MDSGGYRASPAAGTASRARGIATRCGLTGAPTAGPPSHQSLPPRPGRCPPFFVKPVWIHGGLVSGLRRPRPAGCGAGRLVGLAGAEHGQDDVAATASQADEGGAMPFASVFFQSQNALERGSRRDANAHRDPGLAEPPAWRRPTEAADRGRGLVMLLVSAHPLEDARWTRVPRTGRNGRGPVAQHRGPRMREAGYGCGPLVAAPLPEPQ